MIERISDYGEGAHGARLAARNDREFAQVVRTTTLFSPIVRTYLAKALDYSAAAWDQQAELMGNRERERTSGPPVPTAFIHDREKFDKTHSDGGRPPKAVTDA